jgi:hypothetical protein
MVHRKMDQSTTYHDHVAPLCLLSTSAVASVSSIAHPLTSNGMVESGTPSGKLFPSIHWSDLPPLGCCPYSSRCAARIHAVSQLIELTSDADSASYSTSSSIDGFHDRAEGKTRSVLPSSEYKRLLISPQLQPHTSTSISRHTTKSLSPSPNLLLSFSINTLISPPRCN